MTTIRDTYINALLADAAYAQNLRDGLSNDELASQLKTRLTAPQAAFVAENFRIASHHDSDEVIGSGFDATVWQGNVGTPYAGKVC